MSTESWGGIVVDGVSRAYRRGSETVVAVDDVSMRIDVGRMTALVGPSGSGKTTLLDMVMGETPPDRGTISGLTESPDWNDLAFVPQQLGLLSELTIRENISLPVRLGAAGERDVDELMAALGIEVVVDAPGVGENLHDHLGVYLTYACNQPLTLYALFRPDRAARALANAVFRGTGPATSIPLEAGGFLKTRAELDRPDIHITFVPGLNLETTRAGQRRHGYLINFYPMRPASRGSVHIASADPAKAPTIDPDYLGDERDLRCFRDGMRLARQLGRQPALARYRQADISPVAADLSDDRAIDTWVRAGANTVFHPVGSCRMGADIDAPLDADLRVRGVDGLRVADASVMPRIVGGNTSAPCMMIAERAADLILKR